MQFIKNGPDIPEHLLQRHEDGKVVFFCGAGISTAAGYPTFRDLVRQLYDRLEPSPTVVQKTAIRLKQYDTAIYLLEEHVQNGRERVRAEIADILSKDSAKPTAYHRALLDLGKNKDGRTRLVTTNFDRLFELLISEGSILTTHKAPQLPIPNNQWNGLVYLHGQLPESLENADFNDLVVSSGDFGKAYLTERWASRFISELFRRYSVCFIGYSINDPVLRYMMDALAADRSLGENPPEMFAFGSYSKGKKIAQKNEWMTKNVTPILYQEHSRHYYLRETLNAWADAYHVGFRGKEQIVAENAPLLPSGSTVEDNFVGRLLWAMGERGGVPAKAFADTMPPPHLDWLKEFTTKRFGLNDLERFGLKKTQDVGDDCKFSLVNRPIQHSDYTTYLSARISPQEPPWDNISHQIGRWLSKHLNNLDLIFWVVENGGVLHTRLRDIFQSRIAELRRMKAHDAEAFTREQLECPDGVPCPSMLTLWNVILNDKSHRMNQLDGLFSITKEVREGTFICYTSTRQHIRSLLTPFVSIRRPFILEKQQPVDVNLASTPFELIDYDISFKSSHIRSTLPELSEYPNWQVALPSLLPDLTALLKDALDLMQEMGNVNAKSDPSWSDMASISPHHQNRNHSEWTTLIELSRIAWDEMNKTAPEQAHRMASHWNNIPYPTFKRLAFYAATKSECIPPKEALDWLLAPDPWFLWSNETNRETIRLIAKLADRLNDTELDRLERCILDGPPNEMFREDIESDKLEQYSEEMIWLRLAKMEHEGRLTSHGQEALDILSKKYPKRVLSEDQRDEFNFWTESGPDMHFPRRKVAMPKKLSELIDYLRNTQRPPDPFDEKDDWPEIVRNDCKRAGIALIKLAQENVFPIQRWSTALQQWREKEFLAVSWEYLSDLISTAPDGFYQECSNALSYWIGAIADQFTEKEEVFLKICDRMILTEYPDNTPEERDPISEAINHPTGHATKALLDWWFREKLEDGMCIPHSIKIRFNQLLDRTNGGNIHGRIILYKYIITLFRVDPTWCRESFISGFNWHMDHTEAQGAWMSFLGSPRIHLPLIEELHDSFLETASHANDLGEYKDNYASFLTYLPLLTKGVFTTAEYRNAITAMPLPLLPVITRTLGRSMSAAIEKREEYWNVRIYPFFKNLWPKDRTCAEDGVSDGWIQVCLNAGTEFPNAVKALIDWIEPVDYLGNDINDMIDASYGEQYPDECLLLLSKMIKESISYIPKKTLICLTSISNAAPYLKENREYMRLDELVTRRGI